MIELLAERADLWAAARANGERRRDLVDEITVIENRVSRLEAEKCRSDHPQLLADHAALERLRLELAELNLTADRRSSTVQPLNELVRRAIELITETPQDRQFVVADGPKVPSDGAEFEIIERCRRRVRELHADHHQVDSAPWPAAVVKRRARTAIEALAAKPLVSVDDAHSPIEWPTRAIRASTIFPVDGAAEATTSFAEDLDLQGVLVWLLQGPLIKAVEKEIDAIAEDEIALDADARKARLSQIASDMLATEREECALIWKLRDKGVPFAFRHDVDPRALLGLADETSARPVQKPSTLEVTTVDRNPKRHTAQGS
jgi:hypothetical protein